VTLASSQTHLHSTAMARAVIAAFALLAVAAQAAPIGPGKPEDTKSVACGECNTHKDYLDHSDPCVCFATDIMTTFANDATKTHTKRTGSSGSGSGSGTHSHEDTTSNIGAAQLRSGWMWHCKPISDSGVWEQC